MDKFDGAQKSDEQHIFLMSASPPLPAALPVDSHSTSSASTTDLALAAHGKYLAIVYACRDTDYYALGLIDAPPALAFRTGLLDYLACAAAGITGTNRREGAEHGVLLRAHLTAASADGAGDGARTLLRAGTAAGRTVLLTRYKYFLLRSEGRFLKGYGKVIAQVAARHRSIAPRR